MKNSWPKVLYNLEVAADWHELTIPQCTMQPSIARVNEQLDPQSSQQTDSITGYKKYHKRGRNLKFSNWQYKFPTAEIIGGKNFYLSTKFSQNGSFFFSPEYGLNWLCEKKFSENFPTPQNLVRAVGHSFPLTRTPLLQTYHHSNQSH